MAREVDLTNDQRIENIETRYRKEKGLKFDNTPGKWLGASIGQFLPVEQILNFIKGVEKAIAPLILVLNLTAGVLNKAKIFLKTFPNLTALIIKIALYPIVRFLEDLKNTKVSMLIISPKLGPMSIKKAFTVLENSFYDKADPERPIPKTGLLGGLIILGYFPTLSAFTRFGNTIAKFLNQPTFGNFDKVKLKSPFATATVIDMAKIDHTTRDSGNDSLYSNELKWQGDNSKKVVNYKQYIADARGGSVFINPNFDIIISTSNFSFPEKGLLKVTQGLDKPYYIPYNGRAVVLNNNRIVPIHFKFDDKQDIKYYAFINCEIPQNIYKITEVSDDIQTTNNDKNYKIIHDVEFRKIEIKGKKKSNFIDSISESYKNFLSFDTQDIIGDLIEPDKSQYNRKINITDKRTLNINYSGRESEFLKITSFILIDQETGEYFGKFYRDEFVVPGSQVVDDKGNLTISYILTDIPSSIRKVLVIAYMNIFEDTDELEEITKFITRITKKHRFEIKGAFLEPGTFPFQGTAPDWYSIGLTDLIRPLKYVFRYFSQFIDWLSKYSFDVTDILIKGIEVLEHNVKTLKETLDSINYMLTEYFTFETLNTRANFLLLDPKLGGVPNFMYRIRNSTGLETFGAKDNYQELDKYRFTENEQEYLKKFTVSGGQTQSLVSLANSGYLNKEGYTFIIALCVTSGRDYSVFSKFFQFAVQDTWKDIRKVFNDKYLEDLKKGYKRAFNGQYPFDNTNLNDTDRNKLEGILEQIENNKEEADEPTTLPEEVPGDFARPTYDPYGTISSPGEANDVLNTGQGKDGKLISDTNYRELYELDDGTKWDIIKNGDNDLGRINLDSNAGLIDGNLLTSPPFGRYIDGLFDQFNRLYIITEFGLARYDYQNWYGFIDLNGFLNPNPTSIIRDHNNKIWIGTKFGISCYDPGKNWINYSKYQPIYDLENNQYTYNNNFKNIIVKTIVTNETIENIQSFPIKKIKKLNKSFINKEDLTYYPESFEINCLYFDSNNKILVGTNNGLIKIDPDTFDIEKVLVKELETDFNNYDITSITESDNYIWATTIDSGLFKIDKTNYNNVTQFKRNDTFIASNNLTSVVIKENDNIFIGNAFDGLNFYDESGNDWDIINNQVFIEGSNIEPFFINSNNNKLKINIKDKIYELTINNTLINSSSTGEILSSLNEFKDINFTFVNNHINKYIKITNAVDPLNITYKKILEIIDSNTVLIDSSLNSAEAGITYELHNASAEKISQDINNAAGANNDNAKIDLSLITKANDKGQIVFVREKQNFELFKLISTTNSIYSTIGINVGTEREFNYPKIVSNRLVTMTFYNKKEELLVGTFNTGFFKKDKNDNYYNYTPINSYLPEIYVNKILVDASGSKWIITNYFITKFVDKTSDQIEIKINDTSKVVDCKVDDYQIEIKQSTDDIDIEIDNNDLDYDIF